MGKELLLQLANENFRNVSVLFVSACVHSIYVSMSYDINPMIILRNLVDQSIDCGEYNCVEELRCDVLLAFSIFV